MTFSPSSRHLSDWQRRLPELEALAGPLLDSPAFRRLGSVTFLGILSPRFHSVASSPLRGVDLATPVDDGSRQEHSVGVALTALDLARRLGLSAQGQRYAVAWGLTHDLASWPLSHTSEPAFQTITGLTSRQLRDRMLFGSEDLPPRYRLDRVLREVQVDPTVLAGLFSRIPLPPDEDLALLKQVVGSPLTPDTLEGTWRCGVVCGVPVPAPGELLPAVIRRGGTVYLDRRYLPVVLEFWDRKAEVYRRYINREDVVLWESAWSLVIQRECAGMTLAESLEVSEETLVGKVLAAGLPERSRVVRYKEPQEYFVNSSLDALPPDLPVLELWRVLRREPIGTSQP
jgi:hypothetical protein